MIAAIYARYSAGGDQTFQSIEGQLRTCKKYIHDKGWELGPVYVDEHITGRTDQRPEFQRMISHAEANQFGALVVYSTDRFSRDKYDSAIYKRKLRQQGINIYYAAENIPEGPEGILLESLMEGWAQYYSEELSRKVKRGMRESALKGKAIGGTRTLGYTTNQDKDYIIVEAEAELVRKIYRLYDEGTLIVDIVRTLNNEGYKTAYGHKFNKNLIRRILTDKRYIGRYKYKDVIIEDGMPVIIDKPLFYRVQEKLGMNYKKPRNRQKYLLSGKLFCGLCEKVMSGTSGTSKTGGTYYYYTCKSKDQDNIPARQLEDIVVEETRRLFSSPEELENITDKLVAYIGDKNASEAKISDIENNVRRLRKKRNNLLDLIADTADKRLLDKLDELDEELGNAEASLAREQEKERTIKLSREQVKLSIKMFLEGFDWDEEETQKARIIDALVSKVELFPDKVVIYYNILGPKGEPKTIEGLSSHGAQTGGAVEALTRTFVRDGFIVRVVPRI